MQSFFALTGFTALNAFVLATSTLLALRFSSYKPRSWNHLFLSIFLLASAQIFLSQMIPGLFGMLQYGTVWMINILFFLIACLLTYFVTLSGRLLSSAEGCWRRRAFLCFVSAPHVPFVAPLSKTSDSLHITTWIQTLLWPVLILAPFLILFLLRYQNAILQVPLVYDDLAYHLPFAVEWLKTGSILQPYYSAFSGPIGFYPGNGELLDLWAMLPFGKDALVNLINIPILLAFIIALYRAARNFGASQILSLCCTAILMTLPVMLRLLGTALGDVFFIATFVCTIVFLQEYWKSKQWNDLFLFGLSAGLFCGTKYLGIPYVLPPVGIAILLMSLQGRIKKMPVSLGIMLLGLLLGGGYWYLRNWWQTGNPIFPAGVTLFGWHLFAGYGNLTEQIAQTSLAANIADLNQWQTLLTAFFRMTGILGVMILIAWVGCMGMAIFHIFGMICKGIAEKGVVVRQAHHDTRKCATLPALASILLPLFFVSYWYAPYSYQILLPNIRYALPFLAAGILALALSGSRSKIWEKAVIIATPLAIALNLLMVLRAGYDGIPPENRFIIDSAMITSHPELLMGLIVCCIGFFATGWLLIDRRQQNSLRKSTGIILVTILIFCALIARSLPLREQYADHFYEQWYGSESPDHKYAITQIALWFDQNAPEAAIAYSGLNMHYPLFGRNLQRDVRYVNINDCAECRYADFRDAPDSIRTDPDYESWLANLQAENIDYLVIDPVTLGIRSFENEWAQVHPEQFKKIMETGNIMIYMLK